MERIDETDATILRLLQENGRIKRSEVAEHVGLSLPSTSERMRKLEDRGVITGYYARVDPKRIHVDITAFVRVRVDGSNNYPEFVERVSAEPEILEVHSITGDGSHVVKLRTRNTTTLEQLLSRIQSWPGVAGTTTSIVLTTHKESYAIAVQPMILDDSGHENSAVSSSDGGSHGSGAEAGSNGKQPNQR
jgi:Lrp/AsnC family leucine-responsive transcriptional regulator